jgi:hypothetical protein
MRGMLIATLLIAVAAPIGASEPPFTDTIGDISFDFSSVETALGSSIAKGSAGEHAQSAIIEFLQLTPEQVEEWNSLLESAKAESELIREDIRTNNQELRELFEAGDPEAEDVGSLVIDNHNLGTRLGEIHRVYFVGFRDMLDQPQRHRLNFVRRAVRVQPVIPAFRAFGLLPLR